MDEKLIVTRDAFKHGTGAPNIEPDFIGQLYIDTDSRTVWHATSMDSQENWTSDSGSTSTSNLPFIVVTDLGASPDGATPSSYAINTAIEQATSTSKIGAVYLPGGTYIIDAPILLKDNLYIFGDGFTILKQASHTNMKSILQYFSTTNSEDPTTEYNITVKNLILDGDDYTNNKYDPDNTDVYHNCGIILENANNCHFDSIEIRNCGFDGLVLKDRTTCCRNTFSNISVRSNSRYGIFVGNNCSNNRFINCQIEFNMYSNIECLGYANSWNSCRIGSSKNSVGVSLSNSDNSLSNCEIIDNATTGIICNGGSSFTQISGCRLSGNSRTRPGEYPHISIGDDNTSTVRGVSITSNQFTGSVSSMSDIGSANTCVNLGNHSGCVFSSNSVYFNTLSGTLDLNSRFISGLKIGDTINNVTIINSNSKPQPTLGVVYLENDTGYLTYYNFAENEWVSIENPPGDDQDLIVNSIVSQTSMRAQEVKASVSISSPKVTTDTLEVTNSVSFKSISSKGTISGKDITATGNVSSDSASVTNKITAKSVDATVSIGAPQMKSTTLESTTGTINTINSTTGTITTLNSTTGNITNIKSSEGTITTLGCSSLKIGTNKILFGDSVPKDKTYKSGDLLINTSESSDIIMWIYRKNKWVEIKASLTSSDNPPTEETPTEGDNGTAE